MTKADKGVLAQAYGLSTLDKVRLIEKVTPRIEEEIRSGQAKTAEAFPSLWGTFRDLGSAPSGEEIDQVRQDECR